MVDFMLNNLGSIINELTMLAFKILVEVIHFDLFISGAVSYAVQRQAAFLSFILSDFLRDHRIDHDKAEGPGRNNDDPLPLPVRTFAAGRADP